MNMKRVFIGFILFVLSMSYLWAKPDKVLEEFNRQLQANNLVFSMPADFIQVKIDPVKCEDVNYYYAVKHKNKKLEIRYSTFPYEKAIKEPGHVQIGSDDSYEVFTTVVIENIAGDERNIIESAQFDKDAVKAEFGADWGSTTLVKAGSGFGDGYKYAMIISLYKSGSGYAYITYLFDDVNEIMNEFNQAFYSLKFKTE